MFRGTTIANLTGILGKPFSMDIGLHLTLSIHSVSETP